MKSFTIIILVLSIFSLNCFSRDLYGEWIDGVDDNAKRDSVESFLERHENIVECGESSLFAGVSPTSFTEQELNLSNFSEFFEVERDRVRFVCVNAQRSSSGRRWISSKSRPPRRGAVIGGILILN